MIYNPHGYQRDGAKFLIQNPYAGLLWDPGLGKTSATLLAYKTLKRLGLVKSALVVAPLRVCTSVWLVECQQWDSFNDLIVSPVVGTPKQRDAALKRPADIYTINPETIQWLVKNYRGKIPDFLIVDESGRWKKGGGPRFMAIKKIVPEFKRRVILNGTPIPNSIEDIWGQIYLLDQGEALGKNKSRFYRRYFYKGGFKGREWKLIPGREEEIYEAIAHLVLRMDAEDYLDLPDLIVNDIWVELPPTAKKAYKAFERELFAELDSGIDLMATSAGSKYLACRQFANGGVYVDGEAKEIHTAKVEALADLKEELGGKPLLVAYQFKHDLQRLRKRFGARTPYIGGGVKTATVDKLVADWNESRLPLLLCQPQSMSHGLNMQGGGNDVAFFGLPDQVDCYDQLIKRVYRQGVSGSVRVHRFLTRGTVDSAMAARTKKKQGNQKKMLDYLNDYRKEQYGNYAIAA